MRPTSTRVVAAAETVGSHLLVWRKLHALTAQQVAERAGIGRGTLRKIETGDAGVSFEAVLSVMNALGLLADVVTATDPYESAIGRARADEALPQRVRR